MSYENDKYAPQPGESADVVHKKHLQLIEDQKAENRKAREHNAPPHPAKADEHQPNPADAHQPVATHPEHAEAHPGK